jgi:hypothetical protein
MSEARETPVMSAARRRLGKSEYRQKHDAEGHKPAASAR